MAPKSNNPKAPPTKSYRLTDRTIDNLTYLVDMGAAKNHTDAIEKAVEHMATEERTKRKLKDENELI
jgi:arylamine N-acetyltransferase